MYTKEDFENVWKDSSRDAILNQFYHEHKENVELRNRCRIALEFVREKRKVFEWYDTDLFYLECVLEGRDDDGTK